MPSYPSTPNRRALYRYAKRKLYKALVRRWRGSRASLDRQIRVFLRGRRRAYLIRLARGQAFALTVATALLISVNTYAAPPIELADIALDANTGGFALNGEAMADRLGLGVSGAGDVNGDGLADLIVGADYADPNGSKSGKSYVVFGKATGDSIDLSNVASGMGGFAINGEEQFDHSGFSVSGVGDVNGDGLGDVIVGAWSRNGTTGTSYVVFGKVDGTIVELSSVASGIGGFAINGELPFDNSGRSVSMAGDVNGDGLADIIIGAFGADVAQEDTGKSYVVFGKSDGETVELSELDASAGGFVIKGESDDDNSGFSVSGAGDVNGDGLADLIVGAGGAYAGDTTKGKSYVVFGKVDGTAVELTSVAAGSGGFVINGETMGDRSGFNVSEAGDVNGDGLDDLIIGAPYATANAPRSGKIYVVFGKTDGTVVELSSVAAGSGGFKINGEAEDDFAGGSVSGAGDVNGDGLADVIVGAIFADPSGVDSGKSYLVFGKVDGTAVELSTVASGIGGFAINGEAPGDLSGLGLSEAGDVNGDGLADIIVGAVYADPNGESSGKSYVIFSPIAGPDQWVDFAFAGTPEGTEPLPFQRLAHAVNAVTPGGTITIKGGTAVSDSPETLIIDKAVTINAVNGAVAIGNAATRSINGPATTASRGFIFRREPG